VLASAQPSAALNSHTYRVEPTTIVDATLARECSEGIGTLMGTELSGAPCTNPARNTNTRMNCMFQLPAYQPKGR
jgi:hypothetical protein